MAPWILFFDGLYEPRYRPWGIATYGFEAWHGADCVHRQSGLVARPYEGGSANLAEFGALLAGLLWLEGRKDPDCPLDVRGDNRLVIESVRGTWALRSKRLLPLRDAARSTLDRLGAANLKKISREENARADGLSREAYHAYKETHPGWPRIHDPPPRATGTTLAELLGPAADEDSESPMDGEGEKGSVHAVSLDDY